MRSLIGTSALLCTHYGVTIVTVLILALGCAGDQPLPGGGGMTADLGVEYQDASHDILGQERAGATAKCGDEVCTATQESCGNCPKDCGCSDEEICDGSACVEKASEPEKETPFEAICGDGFCAEPDENCETCGADCTCGQDETCTEGECVEDEDIPFEPLCGDNVCAPFVEDCGSCAQDCPCGQGLVCEDNQCVESPDPPDETICGDGVCDGEDEGCQSCTLDCACTKGEVCEANQCVEDIVDPPNGSICGDGVCTPGQEDCGSCLEDCPCPGTTTCTANQCVTDGVPCPDGDCADSCPNMGWTCDNCAPGEVCVEGRCGPVAVVLTTDGNASSFPCPVGMSIAGRWRTSLDENESEITAKDAQGLEFAGGWAYLCSARPTEVFISVGYDDCGVAPVACPGESKGSFHVGTVCGGEEIHGVDGAGNGIRAGWLKLCVSNQHKVKIEASLDICGQITPLGCGAWASLGSWHPVPSNCGGGEIANTASAQLLKSGWVDLCVDSDRFPATDPTTLQDKALFGYQGWFKAAGDGSGDHWHHWFSGKPANASNATFDLWPDLSEFGSDELFATNMSYPDGSTAKVFSSYKTQTVRRHFKWMAETGIDGVFLQRFLSELKDFNQFSFRNKVTDNVCAGATEHGRAFAIMYDISGADPETFVEDLKVDWAYLVEQQGVTGSPAYLRHEGKPVLAIWGPGFHDRPGTAAETLSLINYLQNEAPVHLRAYVVGGVPYHWRTSDGDSKPGFSEVYAHYDAISPWSVGRYADQTAFSSNFNATVLPDKNYVAQIGSDYAPVAWPGFSWANLKKTPGSFNQIPRQGGQFFWHQVRKLYEINPLFLYVAMFDEVDEATAMFKAVTAADKVPVNGTWLHLGEDGWALPSDWYLRLGGAAAKAMQKQFVPQGSLPYQPTP